MEEFSEKDIIGVNCRERIVSRHRLAQNGRERETEVVELDDLENVLPLVGIEGSYLPIASQ